MQALAVLEAIKGPEHEGFVLVEQNAPAASARNERNLYSSAGKTKGSPQPEGLEKNQEQG